MSALLEAMIIAWCTRHIQRFMNVPVHLIVHPDDRAALTIAVKAERVKIAGVFGR